MDDVIRILIVDDHFMVRMGLATSLNDVDDMQVVGEAGTAEEAVCSYRQLQPDVTLMDQRLPDADGVSAIRRIREEFSSARILVLSINESEEDIYQAVKAGAMGYLPKSVEPHELLHAIRSVSLGEKYFPPLIASRMTARGSRPSLTAREQQVIELLAEGLSNKEIASFLHISPRSAKLHVSNLLKKMGVLDRTQAVSVERVLAFGPSRATYLGVPPPSAVTLARPAKAASRSWHPRRTYRLRIWLSVSSGSEHRRA